MTGTMIVADDLTGALDAGVRLLPADVLVETTAEAVTPELLASGPAALAVNAGTRHLDADAAASVVGSLVGMAREAGVGCVVKKTDSALRGNVGAELAAAWRASGRDRLHFIPALPEMGRVTVGGVHYVNGVPVEESSFGRDPFEPVTCSDVTQILRRQTEAPILSVREGEPVPEGFSGIVVYDATTAQSMDERVRELARRDELGAVAGCSGVTASLARTLDLGPAVSRPSSMEEGNLLVVCGSVNQASRAQCAYAGSHGASVMPIGAIEKCDDSWLDGADGRAFVAEAAASWAARPLTVVDGSGLEDLTGFVPREADVRQVVACHIGALLVRVCERGVGGRVLVTGGDVLSSFLEQAGVQSVRPLGQHGDGIVGFEVDLAGRGLVTFSKSGGFGSRELLVEMAAGSRDDAKECCAHA